MAGDAWRNVHGAVTGRPTNFSWLVDGKVAGSGRPIRGDEVRWLASQGVKAIVTMTEDPLPDSWLEDFESLHLPTVDFCAPSQEDIDSAVAFMREKAESGSPVMVHCAAGRGRAGTILACYLVKHAGMGAAEAVEEVRRRRPGSVQSPEQEAAIEAYAARVR